MGLVENLKFAMQRGRRGDSHRCGHLGVIRVDTALAAECVPCVRSGDTWEHLVRGGSLADSMSDYLIRTLRQTPNIDIRYHAEVVGASGERRLQRLKIRDTLQSRHPAGEQRVDHSPFRALRVLHIPARNRG